jgi:hypothetical protein
MEEKTCTLNPEGCGTQIVPELKRHPRGLECWQAVEVMGGPIGRRQKGRGKNSVGHPPVRIGFVLLGPAKKKVNRLESRPEGRHKNTADRTLRPKWRPNR